MLEAEKTEIESIFNPRKNIDWIEEKSLKSVWSGIYVIENPASRSFWQDIYDREAKERRLLREAVEDLIRGYPSQRYRSWMSDFDFMAKLLRAEQLMIYAPYFYRLSRVMPLELKTSRRKVVGKYIENRLSLDTPYLRRQFRKFVRSSVILYPATELFELSDAFIRLINMHRDQSVAKTRERVRLMVRYLLMMSDDDLVRHYQSYRNYCEHLTFLQGQCEYLRLSESDILTSKIPDEE
ncbi:hypothetical protein [Sneathiella glossodoripedis]|uniref:hypothetical protein n=1 Tax=Sneathiella glossodoripedis TaxID=418853 RepID=UPI000471EA52|nr:hypothetical protein [Sneathiella glossodoripedis]